MKALLKIASFLYFAGLFYIFFLARRRGKPDFHWGHRILHLKPFSQKIRHFESTALPIPKEQWNFYTDLFGNIIVFIPLAFILGIVFNVKSLSKIILIAFITSVSVELVQFILRIGVADIDDVILNTLGACIGVFLLKLLRKSTNPLVQKTGLFIVK